MTNTVGTNADGMNRIQNYEAPHHQVMPRQISGAIARTKANIDNAAKALPWHYFIIASLLFAECLAWGD